MPAGATYSTIATYTTTGTEQSYAFTSVPSTYTDLILVTSLRVASGGDNICVRFNSDTGSNYSYLRMFGNGSTRGSDRGGSTTQAIIGNESTTQFTSQITHIQSYANTTTNKTLISRSNQSDGEVNAWVCTWRNTAAINTILIRSAGGGGFVAGSTFTLYGIASA